MEALINRIIAREWQMFQAVNAGQARAACQEDPEGFARIRHAQFAPWGEEACRSYAQDLEDAAASGRNLLEEKYIHMMARCTPESYVLLKTRLPEISQEHRALAEAVNRRMMAETAEMHKKYPFLARIGRPMSASQDSPQTTSIETYQLGELLTYSRRTLEALLRRISALEAEGQSLAAQIQLGSLQVLGFASFEDAAAQLAPLGTAEPGDRL